MGHESLCYQLTPARVDAAWSEAELVGTRGDVRDADGTRLAEFFGNEELSGARTFFPGVSFVLPGEMLVIEGERVRQRELARPRLERRLQLASWEAYVEQFAALFRQAVARSIGNIGDIGDIGDMGDTDRVAVMMSGGLDSGPIAACARELLGASRPVDAYSWQLRDAEADEARFVNALVARHGLGLEWVDCHDAEPFSNLEQWPVHPTTPEQTAYRLFHQRCYERAAQRGHRLLLTGFSGDSLYGNARGWAWDLLRAEGPGRAIDRLRECAGESGWMRTIRSNLLAPLLPRARTLADAPAPYLTPHARRLLAERRPYPADLESARRPRQARRILALLDSHGAEVERFYTAPFGLEARTPLRDFDLVEFMLASPSHLMQQGTETRPVLRAAMRGHLAEEVRRRRGKSAFAVTLERGVERARATWARRLLFSDDAIWRPYVEESDVRAWLDEPLDRGWRMSGLLHVLYGELWRARRAGADFSAIERGS